MLSCTTEYSAILWSTIVSRKLQASKAGLSGLSDLPSLFNGAGFKLFALCYPMICGFACNAFWISLLLGCRYLARTGCASIMGIHRTCPVRKRCQDSRRRLCFFVEPVAESFNGRDRFVAGVHRPV